MAATGHIYANFMSSYANSSTMLKPITARNVTVDVFVSADGGKYFKVSITASIYINKLLITNAFCCPTRIRTSTYRIKICCTTLILWDKRSAKVRLSPLFSKHQKGNFKKIFFPVNQHLPVRSGGNKPHFLFLLFK